MSDSSRVRSLSKGADQLDGHLHYDPARLLDELQRHLNVPHDYALCKALKVTPPTLSKVRNRRLAVTALLLVRMHEVSGLSIRDLRAMMGDRREHFTPIGAACLDACSTDPDR